MLDCLDLTRALNTRRLTVDIFQKFPNSPKEAGMKYSDDTWNEPTFAQFINYITTVRSFLNLIAIWYTGVFSGNGKVTTIELK